MPRRAAPDAVKGFAAVAAFLVVVVVVIVVVVVVVATIIIFGMQTKAHINL